MNFVTRDTTLPPLTVAELQKLDSAALHKLLPQDKWGDRVFGTVDFARCHNRLPTEQNLFNDVIYRIKTSDEIDDPLRVFCTDKEFVKMFVRATIGDQFNVPTLAILNNYAAVDEFEFPDVCCIKPTHLSGEVVLKDGTLKSHERGRIKAWFNRNHYRLTREANYKNLKPKIIVEPILFGNTNLLDYKFFCYKGTPRLIQIDIDRYADHSRKYFDLNWVEQDFSITYKKSAKQIEKPANLEQMVNACSLLSHHFSFIRIDLYSNGEDCKVGEITSCPGSATERFLPAAGEQAASELIFGPLSSATE